MYKPGEEMEGQEAQSGELDELVVVSKYQQKAMELTTSLHRTHFPDGFVFGAATASYQVEGAYKDGGREMSIWDTFCRTPGKVLDGSNGDVADDQYHKYLEDIDLMGKMNLDAYRFSISWSRILSYRGSKPEVNKEGVAYYNNLIDGLLKKGITPYATLYHWDLPQALYDEYRGWIDRRIVKDFADYAEVCFSAFGDRVKHWMTFNEPQQFSILGHGIGFHAPGRCSDRKLSAEGDSATEPYLVVHHVLLAHATAYEVYKSKFKPTQGGTLGMALDCEWGEPLTNSGADKEAAERHVLFQMGWLLDPIYFGDYPAVMRKNVGDRLPVFTRDEIALLNGSVDFVGVNHYSSRFISDGFDPQSPLNIYPYCDRQVQLSVLRNGSFIGSRAASEWLYIVPWGLGKLLTWITKRYNRPQMFVTENGMDDHDDDAKPRPLQDMLGDTSRIAFYESYLTSVLQAIRDGADVRGYFAWSLLDNFEWAMGYSKRFGLVYVDYKNKQKRYPKASAFWYTQFLSQDCDNRTGLAAS
ncbi:hypothetical protein M758_7G108700 [Ceratodon purpureus]|nr:hypothetical protein M758_7G108700 [Ceratodon purpureus]